MELSQNAQAILKNGIGYRSDDTSEVGGALLNPMLVFDQEIVELRNEDILDCANDYHHWNVAKTAEEYEDDPDAFVRIDQAISNTLDSSDYQVIWLCDTPKNAKRYADSPDDIYDFELPKKCLILSDLADEGALIAFIDDGDENDN